MLKRMDIEERVSTYNSEVSHIPCSNILFFIIIFLDVSTAGANQFLHQYRKASK